MSLASRWFSLAAVALAVVALAGCDGTSVVAPDAGAAMADGSWASDATVILDPAPRVADAIVSAPGATGEGFGDASRATNGVRGGGPIAGGLDVYSLDFGTRTELVLAWTGSEVENGPGADIVVFENAFRVMGASSTSFMDPCVVSVSRDGETWVALPHRYLAADPSRYSHDPDHWEGFAGVTPVLLSVDTNPVDPFDPIAAGGDAFDLDVLPMDGGAAERIRSEGFVYLRITPAALETDPETGMRYPRDPISNGPDIDGVVARYLSPRDLP